MFCMFCGMPVDDRCSRCQIKLFEMEKEEIATIFDAMACYEQKNELPATAEFSIVKGKVQVKIGDKILEFAR